MSGRRGAAVVKLPSGNDIIKRPMSNEGLQANFSRLEEANFGRTVMRYGRK